MFYKTFSGPYQLIMILKETVFGKYN